MSDVKEKSSKFSDKDFSEIARTIVDDYQQRKKDRNSLEKRWKEIDRQLRLEPKVLYKRSSEGTKLKSKTWMPEMELPLQSQALEVLLADSRSMMFPDVGDFFCARADAPRKYLEQFAKDVHIVVNDDVDLPSMISQENVDDYVTGWVNANLKQFDHVKSWDLVLTDALKYGVGVGRARLAKKPSFIHDARGTFDKTSLIPVLAPVSIKDVYLDENENNLFADGTVLSPSVIFRNHKKLEDIQLAAQKGSKNAKDADGGWMPKMLDGLEGDKDGLVEYIEYEGDLIVSKSDGSIYIPNAIVTIATGTTGGKYEQRVIRFRLRKYPTSSYIQVPYQREHIQTPYSTSPLMKGEPIQRAASEALNRFMQSAILNTEPPISYPRDDQYFAAKGGPVIVPGAQWGTEGEVTVHEIGNPEELRSGYMALVGQYSDVTGISAPRLGAQTVSHTTAYAKNQEIQRGQSRTVSFISTVLEGPMTQWLYMHYEMSKDALGDRTEQVYMEKFGAFVNVEKKFLPEKVNFDVYGSAGPQDEAVQMQKKTQAIMSVLQINQLGVQQGTAKPLNIEAIEREILKQGGIQDVDAFLLAGANGGAAPQSGVPGGPQAPGNPQAATIALQDLVGLSGQG